MADFSIDFACGSQQRKLQIAIMSLQDTVMVENPGWLLSAWIAIICLQAALHCLEILGLVITTIHSAVSQIQTVIE